MTHTVGLDKVREWRAGESVTASHGLNQLAVKVTIPDGSLHPRIELPGFGSRCIHDLQDAGWIVRHIVRYAPLVPAQEDK